MNAPAAIHSGSRTEDLGAALNASFMNTDSDTAACLLPLLEALHWHGNSRDVLEALPHYGRDFTVADLSNVLARLGVRTLTRVVRQGSIDPRLAPCFMVLDEGCPVVLLEIGETTARIFDGSTRDERTVQRQELTGTAHVVARAGEAHAAAENGSERAGGSWIRSTLARFRRPLRHLLWITFGLNILALSVPLFVMVVYDQVVPAQSGRLLMPLMIGLFLALGLELALRVVRARSLAFIGGRMEHLVATSVFGKLLALPAALTDTAPMGAQVARLKEFDSLRDVFSGPMATVVLELPFVLFFVGVIALIAGPLALVPLGLLGALALAGVVLLPRLKESVRAASRARAERHGFVMEAVNSLRNVTEAAAAPEWRARHRDFSAEAALAQRKSGQANALLDGVGQAAMMLAGVLTVALGAQMVMDGTLSVGALIAVMALTWRVLSPINGLFLAASRAGHVTAAADQIDRLMSLSGEQVMGRGSEIARNWRGQVTFSRVTLRYQNEAEPALLGFSLAIKPGEFIAISGSNGSGKSSILRLVLGLYRPQAGQVSVDGQDIRQIPPADLRHAIGYVPQHNHFFHGTVAQNLRLANPLASEEEMVQACHAAGLLKDIVGLPNGFETRLGDQTIWQFNTGFRQRLALARAYVKRAPILLLDEPAQGLDERADRALTETLERLRGQTTILMISHRPSHIRLADRVLVLDKGALVASGKPDDVLKANQNPSSATGDKTPKEGAHGL